jgi:hypothetical protein
MHDFVETFHRNDGHWMPYRSNVVHDAQNHRMLLIPNRTDGDYYCFTGTAKPGQAEDYGLFGDATGGAVSIDAGLASGSFSEDAGNLRIFIAYCPTGTQYLTLFSKPFVRACDLTAEGTTITVPLTPSQWPEAENTENFGFRVSKSFVFSHLNEFGVTHHKPWNGVDDGVFWFDNAAIAFLAQSQNGERL